VRKGSESGRLPGWVAATALGGAFCLLITGCQGGSSAPATGATTAPAATSPSAAGMRLSITPASGARRVNPGEGITVTAAGGKISGVTVRLAGDQVTGDQVTGDQVTGTAGNAVTGVLNAARTRWHSTWALPPSARYTVTAKAISESGQAVTQQSSFRTLTPARTFQTLIFEGYHKTYGVGMPIMLTFSQPITDKAAVEGSLQLRTSVPVVGAWYWDGDRSLSFRPRGYWPAHTKVSFTGHLDGVEGAPGLYGTHTLTQSFIIGRSLIVVASTASHHMKVYRNGKLYSRWPISTGRPGDNTPNGTYLTIDKGNPVLMKGPGYKLEVPWSVRFTWTGDYLHDAYWSVGEQGFTNVSHGCVNMAPADAEIYYKMELPGDPVTIKGSPRAGEWDNGWTQWFLSWPKLLRGSALHEAVQAGPDGSTFVSPSALPAATATAPLGQPPAGNWAPS
jgi:lipoprotein-anchoring transpeptidase ErfK/SrfK